MSGLFFPDDDPLTVDPETDLLTAEASSVDGFPDQPDPAADDDFPVGRTWVFNWEQGRFRRGGAAPVEVRDVAAIAVWIETVLHVGQYAYGIFTDAYGMSEPERPLGELVTPAVLADLHDRMKAAILEHDRIDDVDITLSFADDVITVQELTAYYDGTAAVLITDVRLS